MRMRKTVGRTCRLSVATNRNPRGTVLKDGKLSRTGEQYWSWLANSLKVNPNKQHGVISYKLETRLLFLFPI